MNHAHFFVSKNVHIVDLVFQVAFLCKEVCNTFFLELGYYPLPGPWALGLKFDESA
jgi:hypothetical protein